MTLTQAQHNLIGRACRGADGHRRRRIAGAAKELRRHLEQIGVDDQQRERLVREAVAAAQLERCREEELA